MFFWFESLFFSAHAYRLESSRTESYDDMKEIGVDPRWEVFVPFHEYLLKTFPLV